MGRKSLFFLCIFLMVTNMLMAQHSDKPAIEVVGKFIQAVQEESVDVGRWADLETVGKHSEHPFNVEELKWMFQGIDVTKLKFSKGKYSELTKVVTLQMTDPRFMKFDLAKESDGTWKIISIYF